MSTAVALPILNTVSRHEATAKTLVLRSSARGRASLVSLQRAPLPITLDAALKGEAVINGEWAFQIHRDGVPIAPPARFRVHRRVEDAAVDYVELQGRCADGIRIERHCLLLRERPVLLLADTIRLSRHSRIDYRASLPLTPGWKAVPLRRSRAIFLRRRGAALAVLPLGLAQSRLENTWGSLEVHDACVTLHKHAVGRRLLVPLLLDASPPTPSQVRWRPLTVSQQRRPSPSDVAVAYQAYSGGPKSCVLYESLGTRALRSFLGHQTRHTRLFGWFNASGAVEPLLQIE